MDQVEIAVLGGGCFWCLEAVFQKQDGVLSVVSGYAGGKSANPGYRDVCSGLTGHAEVVRIEFDPEIIDYHSIIDLFWRCHDPTTLNRQGADVGSQYRSVIFCQDDRQRRIAEQAKSAASSWFEDPIVTEISGPTPFYPAEDGHQNYYRENNQAPYCTYVIRPKLIKLGLE